MAVVLVCGEPGAGFAPNPAPAVPSLGGTVVGKVLLSALLALTPATMQLCSSRWLWFNPSHGASSQGAAAFTGSCNTPTAVGVPLGLL